MIVAFDHVNVRTNNLPEMTAFYVDVMGFRTGPRPNFSFDGAWMYLGETAVVHLVDVEDKIEDAGNPSLEHFAFRAKDMKSFLAKVTAAGIAHSNKP